GVFYRHRVDLLWPQWRMSEQRPAQVRKVTIRISYGCDALVYLEHMHVFPRHITVSEGAKHDPGCTATAERHHEAPARITSAAGFLSDDRGRPHGDRIGIGQYFDLHGRTPGYRVTVGLCQPPGGVTF